MTAPGADSQLQGSPEELVYAHTPNETGEWHLLRDHLAGTAERASEFASFFEAEQLGWAAGWLHDVGKCSCVFGAYLARCQSDGSPKARSAFPRRDHKTPGALLAQRADRRYGSFLAATILGHHGGMSDRAEVNTRLSDAQGDPVIAQTIARAQTTVGGLTFDVPPSCPGWVEDQGGDQTLREAHLRDVELLYRMVFSALVDADFLDTEAHFSPDAPVRRRGSRDLESLDDRFERRRRALVADVADTPVNRARAEIYDSVLETATSAPGWYRLPAATGAGKTIVGLGWALAHAKAHGLRRVVTAVPFITVTDQVASVYRSLLDDDEDQAVLEHHSAVTGDDGWQKLAAENWDSPVVVTTTVQLFESLFSNKPSECRKLHRLARSVIVLDEAQAIPLEVLDPVVDGLRALVDRFGASVLVMTATQPTLQMIRTSLGREPIDVLPGSERWAAAFARTELRVGERLDHAQLGERVRTFERCLCVLNTIRDAREVTLAAGDHDVLHLSTMLRPADRRARIETIRKRLAGNGPCRVVSTQLVEAGVDLDFPVVLRALAPLPSIAQADGRCNRNGTLSRLGTTVVFELDGGGRPPGAYYGSGTPKTQTLINRPGIDLLSQKTIEEWYGKLLTDPAVHTDARAVQSSRLGFNYEMTASRFRMIDTDTVAVAVPWPTGHPAAPAVEEVLELLAGRRPIGPSRARMLQEITVNLRRRVALQVYSEGLVVPVTDKLYRWTGTYDDQIGLVFKHLEQRELIW